MYPPRYRSDNKHWGRFMQKKTSATHMQTVMPGTVSLKKVNMVDSFQLLTNDLKGKILTLKINNSDFSKSFFFHIYKYRTEENTFSQICAEIFLYHCYSFWEAIRRE